MLKKKVKDILLSAGKQGWVLEPESKNLLALEGMAVPEFKWATDRDEALKWARKLGYPVVAKIVSPDILHKSDVKGVATHIDSDAALKAAYDRFSTFKGFAGILIEPMLSGIELIVGAKIDYHFGPVILLGMGGTEAEIYQDTSLRMAPLKEKDVVSMIGDLKARKLLEGFRGAAPVSMEKLTHLMLTFSGVVMKLEAYIESIDLNPVICASDSCVVADARIMLKGERP